MQYEANGLGKPPPNYSAFITWKRLWRHRSNCVPSRKDVHIHAAVCHKAEKAAFRQPHTEKNLQIPLPCTFASCTMTSVL